MENPSLWYGSDNPGLVCGYPASASVPAMDATERLKNFLSVMQGPPSAALFLFRSWIVRENGIPELKRKTMCIPLDGSFNNGGSILYHGAIPTEAAMKNIKFDDNKDKGRPGSVWWDMIMALTKTVSVQMVEQKFSVQSKDDQESIFDLVLRAGLAPDFPAAVALLANAFPLPPPPPLWKRVLLKISNFGEDNYY